jgi:hypothetical protein
LAAVDKLAERHPASDQFWRNRKREKDEHHINIGNDLVVRYWVDLRGALRVYPLWAHKSDVAYHPNEGYEVPGLAFDPVSGRLEGPELPPRPDQRFPDRTPGPEHVLRYLYELAEKTSDDGAKTPVR